ncbi:MAG TPA: bifunctional helix-turn-helix transcriptional regulator/GNAT family N-acetyltransferase [Gemmatimonadaceae bacterium]|nr:bifunctional helix-turn-helix transcriptional regulator/GNAT family N-acetyltransferase [Gemmatimonadaceae bacterium]
MPKVSRKAAAPVARSTRDGKTAASAETAAQIATIREFNRFYTRQIGVLNREFLDTPFSLAEVRVLYELYYHERSTATAIGQELGVDPGYLSRMLRGFERRGFLAKEPSSTDGRQTLLRLSATGRRAFEQAEARQRTAVEKTLESMAPDQRHQLIGAMHRIERLLGSSPSSNVPYIIRPHQPGDIGWVTHRQAVLYNTEYGWDETFEALVADVLSKFIAHFNPKRERSWIVERDSEIVGSVFCAEKTKTTAALRMLYVEPSARGLGIGTRLVDECIAFARRAGYSRLSLWTNDVLHSARRIYERAGFHLVESNRHHSFGKDLVGQTWELEL